MGCLDPKKVVSHKKVFITSRFRKLERWNKTRVYPNPIAYKGCFENRRNENFTIPQVHFEMICDQIRGVQNSQIQNPSPIHMVWRSQPLQARAWWERVIIRRLGLHSPQMYQRVLIPNTPHYNRLLYQIKHLITMKPLTFPDGVPTEKDIGAVRVEDHSGVVRINEQFRPTDSRLYGDKKPLVFEGPAMRNYLRRALGIFMNHW